jgi:hypothetical protein
MVYVYLQAAIGASTIFTISKKVRKYMRRKYKYLIDFGAINLWEWTFL